MQHLFYKDWFVIVFIVILKKKKKMGVNICNIISLYKGKNLPVNSIGDLNLGFQWKTP